MAPTTEMVEEALLDAARAVYQDQNKASVALRGVAKSLNLGKNWGLGSVLLPFTQVPGSIVMRGTEWTPAGFILSAYHAWAGGPRSQKAAVDAFSRATLGSGGMVLGYYLFKLGLMTALGEEDDDLERMRQASGFGKFRVNISAFKRALLTGNWKTPQAPEDGDLTANYDWMQPTSIPLAMGAEIAHQERARAIAVAAGKETTDDFWRKVFGAGNAAMRTIEDQPLVLGLTRAFAQAGRGPGAALVETALETPGMFVPTFVTRVNEFLSNQVRETRAGTPIEQMVSRLMTRLPGVADKYPPKYDVYGEALAKYDYGGNSLLNVFLNPAFIQQVKHSKELREMEAVYAATGEGAILPARAPTKITFGGQTVELTNEQISEYQRFSGEMTLRIYGRLAASPKYAAAPPGLKAGVLAEGMREVSKEAKAFTLRSNRELLEAIRAQNQQRAAAQLQQLQFQ
jgi:hypothetical protein